MVKRLFLVIIVVASLITAMWALGLFGGILPDPPYDPPLDYDGIAVVTGTVYDLAGNPLTFVRVSCGGETDYTLGGSTFRLEITIDQGTYNLESCALGGFKNGYYSAHVTVQLSDLIPVQADLFLQERP